MKFRNYQPSQASGLPLAPMIDIVFLLLIFFIVTWNYARFETVLDISVPAAEEGESRARPIGEIVVNVRADGEIIINNQVFTEEELLTRLQGIVEFYRDQAVILRGDRATPYEDMINVLDICQKAGIWNIAFATTRPDEESGGGPATQP